MRESELTICPVLPWFKDKFPLFLAPMAGVTNKIFRRLCKEFGVDVVTTEFVSAEGIFRRNERTLEYLDFDDCERPLGVQIFGGDPDHMGEAARHVMDWKQPDFLDLNFGCPVNKVVCKLGGSALLKDCPLLERVATSVVKAVAPFPVTAKIRIGWDERSVNATTTARLLEGAGVRALAVHGRTKAQGYSGRADWDVIGDVVQAVSIPVIGNGDLYSAADVKRRCEQTGVAGVMIGRGAMQSPWIFSQIRTFLETGELLREPFVEEQWDFIRRHCRLAVEARGAEPPALHAMRARLMAYSRGMPSSKQLRIRFQHVSNLSELDEIAEWSIEESRKSPDLLPA
jgi:tRNA-dihydrouridine synthase B